MSFSLNKMAPLYALFVRIGHKKKMCTNTNPNTCPHGQVDILFALHEKRTQSFSIDCGNYKGDFVRFLQYASFSWPSCACYECLQCSTINVHVPLKYNGCVIYCFLWYWHKPLLTFTTKHKLVNLQLFSKLKSQPQQSIDYNSSIHNDPL